MAAKKPRTIDEYLAPLSADKRAALERLRNAIKSAAPKAEECISYQVPAFRLGGRMLVAFGAGANHCAFYPGATPVMTHKDELKAYDTSKGTVRFPVGSSLPATLVRKLVRTRIAEHAGRSTKKREAVPIVTVRNVNVPGHTSRVNAEKYVAMRLALLRVLPSRAPGMTQAEMFRGVKRHLPQRLFPGGAKADWWAKTVQLDLEAKRIVRRSADAKPLRWYCVKAGK